MDGKARLIIITGMSGAGKSTAANYFEDKGFFCIDNLPPFLLPKIATISSNGKGRYTDTAIVVDIRERDLLKDLIPVLDEMQQEDIEFEVLFLDADDKTIIKRYKETRRTHPFSGEMSLPEAIAKEREILADIKSRADYVIDNSQLLTREFLQELDNMILNKQYSSLVINIMSFGFKYGIPVESDLVFDVRFLPNPHYVPSLKNLTGKSQAVRNYIFRHEETGIFMDKLTDMLQFLIPQYIKEGKQHLIIAIGCTGGRHRSVAISNEIASRLKKEGHSVVCRHRDIAGK
ncbi:MAG TPA: RNase adapter RapZ [Clostridiales bacterium]|nr:RNase adapter RapZ [Clostridiales bacterium]